MPAIDRDEPWVILIDYTANGNAIQVFHIEPLFRYRLDPPIERWTLHKITDTPKEAFDWLYSDEAEGKLRLILTADKILTMGGLVDNPFKKTPSRKFKRQKIDRTVRVKVFERDNYRCRICGATADDGVKLEVDHIIPRAEGGTNHIDNLQILCFDCNRGKRDKILPNLLERNGAETL